MTKYTGSHMSKSTAVVTGKPPLQLAIPPSFATQEEWASFRDNIARAHASNLLPSNIKTPEQALVIALKGRELRLEPLYALSVLHLINGKVGMAAEAMLALVYRDHPKAKVTFITPTEKRNEECTVRVQREFGDPQEFTFSIGDAKLANLTSKENWRMYPAAMLRSRATSAAVRATWPECVMGCMSVEELTNSMAAVQSASASEIDSRFVDTPPQDSTGGLPLQGASQVEFSQEDDASTQRIF